MQVNEPDGVADVVRSYDGVTRVDAWTELAAGFSSCVSVSLLGCMVGGECFRLGDHVKVQKYTLIAL